LTANSRGQYTNQSKSSTNIGVYHHYLHADIEKARKPRFCSIAGSNQKGLELAPAASLYMPQ
jgi:hypothetical protein